MRGKRAKAYKKLMASYSQSFGFREPYQVLLDDAILLDAVKFKMDLQKSLEQTLRGKVKPLITQCCIRHLYALASPPQSSTTTTTTPPKKKSKNTAHQKQEEEEVITPEQAKSAVVLAKTLERRRCNHSISDDPLSSLDCLRSVILPDLNNTTPKSKEKKSSKNGHAALEQAERELNSDCESDSDTSPPQQQQNNNNNNNNNEGEEKPLSRLEALRLRSKSYNKHRYILATNSPTIRLYFREYPGIPGIHIKRSVMVMDTMSDASSNYRYAEEKEKMRSGIKHRVVTAPKKRGGEEAGLYKNVGEGEGEVEERVVKRRRVKGPNNPNPLSVMKKKKVKKVVMPSIYSMNAKPKVVGENKENGGEGGGEGEAQKRNRRKRKRGGSAKEGGEGAPVNTAAAAAGGE